MRHSAFFNLLACIIGTSIGYSEHNTFLPLDLDYNNQLTEECVDIVETACDLEKIIPITISTLIRSRLMI